MRLIEVGCAEVASAQPTSSHIVRAFHLKTHCSARDKKLSVVFSSSSSRCILQVGKLGLSRRMIIRVIDSVNHGVIVCLR